jgi:hypothetical protein
MTAMDSCYTGELTFAGERVPRAVADCEGVNAWNSV